jgi:hypothetical protein
MQRGKVEQHLAHRPAQRSGTACACLLMVCLTAPAQAEEARAGERSAGGHRWSAPMWISAPATSVLAVAGIAGLAAHLFRRRRSDKPHPPGPKSDDDWDQRIAMWEQRLRGDPPQTVNERAENPKAGDDTARH